MNEVNEAVSKIQRLVRDLEALKTQAELAGKGLDWSKAKKGDAYECRNGELRYFECVKHDRGAVTIEFTYPAGHSWAGTSTYRQTDGRVFAGREDRYDIIRAISSVEDDLHGQIMSLQNELSECQKGGRLAGDQIELMRAKHTELQAKYDKLRKAVEELYYSAIWSPDRSVDAASLWLNVRDAAGFEPGGFKKRHGAAWNFTNSPPKPAVFDARKAAGGSKWIDRRGKVWTFDRYDPKASNGEAYVAVGRNEVGTVSTRAVDGKMWVDGRVSDYDIVGPYAEVVPAPDYVHDLQKETAEQKTAISQLLDEKAALNRQIEQLNGQLAHWKGNHEFEVARNRTLMGEIAALKNPRVDMHKSRTGQKVRIRSGEIGTMKMMYSYTDGRAPWWEIYIRPGMAYGVLANGCYRFGNEAHSYDVVELL